MMRLQGRITEREMKTHADQNRLYEALGGNKAPEVETGSAPVSEDHGFLLASDGLWENVEDIRFGERFFEAEHLDEALRRLVDRAKTRGGAGCDNISVAAARYRRAERFFAVAAQPFVASAAFVMAPEAQVETREEGLSRERLQPRQSLPGERLPPRRRARGRWLAVKYLAEHATLGEERIVAICREESGTGATRRGSPPR